jgi:hypothetical protein
MLRGLAAQYATPLLGHSACPSQSMHDRRTALISSRMGLIFRAGSQSRLFSAQVSFHAVDNII